MKCLEKNPEKRYQNSTELTHDLQNFLQNKPVTAKTNNWKFIKKFFYSRKTLLVIIVILIAVIIFLLCTLQT